ncbi:hypothetical protein JGH11_06795 [Dysgonomonas sp. Marseille-P4677]|uniref:YncE family protein n=1 Tax=Dysgonomonas sp. Marseille-P4677 TaxID=2364790 RepID=UPI001911659B|nr:DUF5074 domain-containing protein [Dysgonomonas sp. Marseille-P4677]MBK5720575.1 hypothetical protein [Dysgonomonas sp. Marseille-P4677]
MKNILLKGLFLSLLVCAFIACDSDNDSPWTEPEITTSGVYVLNSGSSGLKVGGSLTYYDYKTGSVTKDIFTNKNGIELGNGAQDMVIYGSKMYISVTKSNCIYVTDKTGKLLKNNEGKDAIIKPMNNSNQPQQPRSVIAHAGYVYVSTYDGDIVRIDTTAINIDKKTATGGTYPEEMTIVNNKLYTVISDYLGTGIGKVLSVINLSSFSKDSDIAVALNPTKIKSDKNGNIYIISNGNYVDVPSSLQKIAAGSNIVTTIGTDAATNMEIAGDKLLLMKEVYNSETKKSTTALSYYDIKENKIVNKSFVEEGKADLTNTYNITVDPLTNNIYMATSDYKNEGNMHIFNGNGGYVKSFKTGGINPMGAYFITGAK